MIKIRNGLNIFLNFGNIRNIMNVMILEVKWIESLVNMLKDKI